MRISDWSSDVCSSDLPILKKLGYTQGSVGDRMNALAKDPKYKFPDNDQGRAEIVAYIQTWLGKIRAELPRAFRTLVKGTVEVKRLPLAEEPGAPAAYCGAGSIDGSIPGRVWINLRTPDRSAGSRGEKECVITCYSRW